MANKGDMMVTYTRIGSPNRHMLVNANLTKEFPVDSVEQARELIDRMATADLNDPTCEANGFSLLVYDPENPDSYEKGDAYAGWYNWIDEEGNDINGYPV